MSTYQIWSEGYRATGDYANARFEGYGEGATFLAAVRNWADANPGRMQPYEIKNLEAGRAAIWGCRLFDNETDARKSFG